MQRPHPAYRIGRPPAHRFRPGAAWRWPSGRSSASTSCCLAALAGDHRDIEFALAVVALLALFERHARRAQEPFHRLFGRADARPLSFFADVGLLGGKAGHRQRQPPRSRERLGAFEQQTAVRQSADDQPLQILSGWVCIRAGIAEMSKRSHLAKARLAFADRRSQPGIACRLCRSSRIPARMQTQAAKDLERLVVGALSDRGLLFEGAKAFAGPRRLTLAVAGLPAKQPDVSEERKGRASARPKRRWKGSCARRA